MSDSPHVPTHHDEPIETLESGPSLQPEALVATRSESFTIPFRGRWEGQLVDLCDIAEANTYLSSSHVVEVQCRKQMIGVIPHRFVLLKLQINHSSSSETESNEAFLRLDRRSDPTAGIGVFIMRRGSTDANDCAMLARDAVSLLTGPRTTIEAKYPLLHQPPQLASLSTLLRICCEELVRYCIWPDNCWFFCSLITSFLADQCPEDLDINKLENMNLAKDIRRRIRIRYHISTGQPIQSLSYVEQLEFVLSAAKGQVLGSKGSAKELIKLGQRVSNCETTRRKALPSFMALPQILFRSIKMKRQWLTVSLSETLYDAWRHPRKASIFQDASRRFQDEAALRGLAPIAGSQATTQFADIGWKLVKYRLYLPPNDAALLMRGVERLARQLLEKEPCMYHKGLLHETLTSYGEELDGPQAIVTGEPRTKKRDIFEDAVKMARLLNDEEPGAHLDSLADSLGSYCLALAELGEYTKACEACRESIERWRELYAQQIIGRRRDVASEEGTHWQQVFREFCWCFCTDGGDCDAISEVLIHAESILTAEGPVEVAEWSIMWGQYGPLLRAAQAAPEGCKTLRQQRLR